MQTQECSFSDLLAHVGRDDFHSRYDFHTIGRSSIKNAQREAVADFLIKHHHQPNVKLLSFPGAEWSFERGLAQIRQVQVVGLERSWSVYAKSRRAMLAKAGKVKPGCEGLQDRSMRYGNSLITYSRCPAQRKSTGIHTRATRSHRLILMDAETYATVLTTDYGAKSYEKLEFYQRFAGRSAVWLDYTCQLCPSVLRTLSAIQINCLPVEVPFVVTVLAGRDSWHGTEARIMAMEHAQPLWKCLDTYTHTSINGARMLTAMGILYPS